MKSKNVFYFKGIFTLVLSVLTFTLSAQNITVSGKVTDSSNEPVIGATIIVAGNASQGTVTDIDGNYTLPGIPSDGTLEFRYVGFMTQTVQINGRSTIDVVMSEDAEMLQEVVVTALGITKQGKSVGYATASVSTSEVERVNTINPINALQGKVAGLDINTTGASGVTSSSSITIRGAKSIDKNNSPIFVVDGMVIQEPLRGALDGTDWGSQLKNLNPSDYESITVLKGAAATALYGSRGANGAIVIKSKGGRYGKQGLGIEISQILETTDIYKSPIELQNIYGAGSAQNGYEGGLLADGSLQRTQYSFGPRMDGSMINQYLPHGQATPFVPHPDNWKSLYQSGLNSNTNFAISGGKDNSSFRIAYSYTDNNGVFKRNKFTRHSLSFRGVTELNHIFSLETGINYAFSRAQNGANQGGWNWGGNLGMITTYYTPRNMDMATYESLYRDPVTNAVETDSPWDTLRGYLHNRDMNLDQRSENSMLSNVTLRAKIAPKLNASIQGNYNYYGISTMWQSYGQGANYGPTGSGGYGRGGNNSGSYNFLGMLQSMDNELNIGSETIVVDGILAAELYGNTESHSWNKSTNGGLVSPAVFAFANSVNRITPNYDYTPRNNQAFGLSAILNLAWKDQLFVEITGRNDWLSTLTYPSYMTTGMNNYTVFYPSINTSWVFSDTFETPDWLSFGKLRASLSRVGMGTSAYSTTRGFGVFSQSSQYDPNRESVLIANPNLGTAWNNDLKPEVQQSLELGTDLRFFNDALNIDFAYYKTNTKNQILTVAAVTEAGASNQLINAGNIQNQGVELLIEGTPVRTADMRWTIGTNFSLNRGKIIELHENVKEWQLMGQYDGGPEIWAFEGGKFGVITTPYNNGSGAALARYNNESNPNDPNNGKPLISYWGSAGSPNAVPVYGYTTNYDIGVPDRVEIGKVEPDFLLSFNTSFSYKNFDFYALVDGRVGGNFFSNTYKYASSIGTLKSSLYGRDEEHGGLPRTNYLGETVHNAYPLDGVFEEGATAPLASDPGGERIDVGGLTYLEALERGINPMPAGAFYAYNLGWGMPSELGLQDNTWFALREITVGYRLPESVLNKLGANYFRIGVTARNLGYLVNKLTDGLNPASISNNNPLTPMDIGAVPFSRTYSLNFTLRF